MRWIILAFMFVLGIINFADKSVIGFSAVPMMKEFNLSYTQWGLVGSCFFWLFSIAAIFGSAWSDKIGTKKTLSIMSMMWTVIQIGSFAITGLPLLLMSRVLLGAGEGPFFTTAINQLRKWFPSNQLGLAISTLAFGNQLGSLAVAPIIVAIIEIGGWRTAFVSLGVCSLVWFILWSLIGREQPKEENLIKAKEAVAIEEIKKNTIVWSKTLKLLLSGTFIFTTLASFTNYWLTSYITVWMPTYFVKGLHFTQTKMGYASAIIGIVSGILTVLISSYIDFRFTKNRSYRKSHVFIGGSALALSGLFFWSIPLINSAAWALIAFTLGKALAFTIPVIASQIVITLLPERGGLMSGIMQGITTVAGMVGPIFTGIIVQSAGNDVSLGFNRSIIFMSVLLIISGALFLLFTKRNDVVAIIDDKFALSNSN